MPPKVRTPLDPLRNRRNKRSIDDTLHPNIGAGVSLYLASNLVLTPYYLRKNPIHVWDNMCTQAPDSRLFHDNAYRMSSHDHRLAPPKTDLVGKAYTDRSNLCLDL